MNRHPLLLRRLGIDTYTDPVIYMPSDCDVCRAEGSLSVSWLDARCQPASDRTHSLAQARVALHDALRRRLGRHGIPGAASVNHVIGQTDQSAAAGKYSLG